MRCLVVVYKLLDGLWLFERRITSATVLLHVYLSLVQVKKLKKGGRAVAYSPDGSTVAVGQNDGGFLILDSVSLEKVVGFKDRKEGISDIKFSPGIPASLLGDYSLKRFYMYIDD